MILQKTIYIVLLLISVVFSQNKSLDVRNETDYHSNGVLKLKAEYYYDSWSEQPVYHGRYCEWTSAGQIAFEAYYVHGKQMGKSVSYYKNGKPKAIEYWANDQLNGRCRYFNKKGELKKEIHYLHGKEEVPESKKEEDTQTGDQPTKETKQP